MLLKVTVDYSSDLNETLSFFILIGTYIYMYNIYNMMFIDYAIGWLRDASNDLSLVCRDRIIAHMRYKMYLYTRPIYCIYCIECFICLNLVIFR